MPAGTLGKKITDTTGCTTASALLSGNRSLVLYSRNSEVRFLHNAVILPTLVSFSVCELDTNLGNPSPKATVFGPLPLLQLLRPLTVKLSLEDAGLPGTAKDSAVVMVYRLNELTSSWEYTLLDHVRGSSIWYQVNRFGTYAVRLAGTILDTTWHVVGLIPPSGGTLNLLTSRLEVPPGAVNSTVPVSFRITSTTPVGLPGSTNRVFDFGPDGTVFQVPITLYVSFRDAGIEGEKISPLRFYYFNTSTSQWERQPTEINWDTGEFVVTLSHFSRYAFGR
jgi:hypothetical protein